jgi:hypothetical protein
VSIGSWRDKTREIIDTLKNGPRYFEDDAHGYAVHPKPNEVDEPEGKITVRLSDTLAKQWAEILESLLDSE